jgi:hypothetical protein
MSPDAIPVFHSVGELGLRIVYEVLIMAIDLMRPYSKVGQGEQLYTGKEPVPPQLPEG